MAHGLLHYCGYGDKKREEQIMRLKEDEKIAMFHVKQYVFSRFHEMLFHVEHIYIFYISLSKAPVRLIVSRGTIVQFVVSVLNRVVFRRI
jgi:hypothetical protein